MTERIRERSISDREILGSESGLVVIKPVAAELFECGTQGDECYLPKDIAENPRLLEMAGKRRKLYGQMGEIFEKVEDPQMEMTEAVRRGLISREELADLWNNLANFIEDDPNNERIILYLPFELIPPEVMPGTGEEIIAAGENLRTVYMKAWRKMLTVGEYRSLYVDGDIDEEKMGRDEQPMVCKAAHLIPKLAEKGMITIEEVKKLTEGQDTILAQSAAESISVLKDMGLWQGTVGEKIETDDRYQFDISMGFEESCQRMESELERNRIRYEGMTVNPGKMTPERVKWLAKDKRLKSAERAAERISERYLDGSIGRDEISGLFNRKGHFEVTHRFAAVRAMVKTVEKMAKVDPGGARYTAETFKTMMEKGWQDENQEVKEAVFTGWCHWHNLGMTEEDYIGKFGIKIPELDGDFSQILQRMGSREFEELAGVVQRINSNPEAAEMMEAAMILFGSRLKGYAAPGADLDAAVWIKPEIGWGKREQLKAILDGATKGVEGLGKVVEFWTTKEGDKIGIKNVPLTDSTVGQTEWAHIILGGVWLGDKAVTEKLYRAIVPEYLVSGDEDRRRSNLKWMEMDTIQFRLMHKGYRRLYPKIEGVKSEHMDMIDGDSDFWDPGFRRVASRLFVSRVFLPDLA